MKKAPAAAAAGAFRLFLFPDRKLQQGQRLLGGVVGVVVIMVVAMRMLVAVLVVMGVGMGMRGAVGMGVFVFVIAHGKALAFIFFHFTTFHPASQMTINGHICEICAFSMQTAQKH